MSREDGTKHEPFLFPDMISQSGIYVLGRCGLQGLPAMHSFHKNIMHIFLPCQPIQSALDIFFSC